MQIYEVTDQRFRKYGRVLDTPSLTGEVRKELAEQMEKTPLPADVVYEPSVEALEQTKAAEILKEEIFGELPIQVGYCNGNNYLLNALEYHRSSEINIATTDLILLLGSEQDVAEDFTYETDKVEAFLVKAGTAVELYATTLHYAPCNAEASGFRDVIVLPKGTNYSLRACHDVTGEDKLLAATNKWLIGHAEGGLPEGSFLGLKGKNISVK